MQRPDPRAPTPPHHHHHYAASAGGALLGPGAPHAPHSVAWAQTAGPGGAPQQEEPQPMHHARSSPALGPNSAPSVAAGPSGRLGRATADDVLPGLGGAWGQPRAGASGSAAAGFYPPVPGPLPLEGAPSRRVSCNADELVVAAAGGSRSSSGDLSAKRPHSADRVSPAAASAFHGAAAACTAAAIAAAAATAGAAAAAELPAAHSQSPVPYPAVPTLPGALSGASAASAPALAAGGSRLQISVSRIGSPPRGPLSAPGMSAAAGAVGAGGEAVGVPVLLLPPSASGEGPLPSITVVGRPAAEAAAMAAGTAAVPLEEIDVEGRSDGGAGGAAGLDEADIVATIVAAGGAAGARRRRGTSGGGGTDTEGEEDAGPAALPTEVRRRLRSHLGRMRTKRLRTWKDLSHSVASPRPSYWQVGTLALLALLLGAFLFMAGQYDYYALVVQQQRTADIAGGGTTGGVVGLPPAPPPSPPLAGAPGGVQTVVEPGQPSFGATPAGTGAITALNATAAPAPLDSPASPPPPSNVCTSVPWGPASLGSWLQFWRTAPGRSFSFDYLRAWGGRYAPDLAAGQWWRWVSSLALHQSSLHLLSNLALMLVLATYLEALYGFWRVLPVWLLAGVAGNMVSALFESACLLVVGASGAIFGLLGMYGADALRNWESIPLLWLRLVGMGAITAFMVALQLADKAHSGGVSHASHAGGFVAGLLVSLVVLPDFKARRAAKVTKMLESLGLQQHLPEPASPGGRHLYSFWQRHAWIKYGVYGIAAVVLGLELLAAPLYVYLKRWQGLTCDD
ncbi:hypothetical protein HYH03_006629 [Edaphochlamys debaryana]|uniref:RHOMBOID-like protein n=1 Tax=Edaphochlamys debaryana TaxID=47281 RepID=A0A835Y3M9_9CHLO|nr:hypothetical protein HYH03_006629 [Edaphochlamys debaryana]|eukprot:KAG2495361.1 hypothetical protein HYH03_006629 [Edaphochlamys debaryana]